VPEELAQATGAEKGRGETAEASAIVDVDPRTVRRARKNWGDAALFQ